MQRTEPAIGISKPCCPVCLKAMDFFTRKNPQHSCLVRGSHTRISACSLPPWIPENILNKMLKYFGGQLRMALSALLSNSVKWRQNQSAESHRMSPPQVIWRTLHVESLQLSTQIGFPWSSSAQNLNEAYHAVQQDHALHPFFCFSKETKLATRCADTTIYICIAWYHNLYINFPHS